MFFWGEAIGPLNNEDYCDTMEKLGIYSRVKRCNQFGSLSTNDGIRRFTHEKVIARLAGWRFGITTILINIETR
jgi:hypothetical protein